MACEEDTADALVSKQRLKAALHYAIGRKCEEIGEGLDVKFTKQFICALNECTFKQCELMATDVEAFAKHARRSTVGVDDVKLLVRRNKEVSERIKSLADSLCKSHNQPKSKGKRLKKDVASTDSITTE